MSEWPTNQKQGEFSTAPPCAQEMDSKWKVFGLGLCQWRAVLSVARRQEDTDKTGPGEGTFTCSEWWKRTALDVPLTIHHYLLVRYGWTSSLNRVVHWLTSQWKELYYNYYILRESVFGMFAGVLGVDLKPYITPWWVCVFLGIGHEPGVCLECVLCEWINCNLFQVPTNVWRVS